MNVSVSFPIEHFTSSRQMIICMWLMFHVTLRSFLTNFEAFCINLVASVLQYNCLVVVRSTADETS